MPAMYLFLVRDSMTASLPIFSPPTMHVSRCLPVVVIGRDAAEMLVLQKLHKPDPVVWTNGSTASLSFLLLWGRPRWTADSGQCKSSLQVKGSCLVVARHRLDLARPNHSRPGEAQAPQLPTTDRGGRWE